MTDLQASSDESVVAGSRFAVDVAGFNGPLDLLLSLIAKHKLELTELSLHKVTDDFVRHVRAQGEDWNLDETTEFLVIAATLLDLKATRLLPGDSVEDADDLELLEARDVLFARLLQYRAYKQMAAIFEQMLLWGPMTLPRTAGLDPGLDALLPEPDLGVDSHGFAAAAVRALTPKEPERVAVQHIHMHAVNVREQALILIDRLAPIGAATFSQLVADCTETVYVVARFLAILELYRDGTVTLEQAGSFAELHVSLTGNAVPAEESLAEFDDYETPKERIDD